MHQGLASPTIPLATRCLVPPKPPTHVSSRCMHSFGNVSPAAAAGRQAVQLSSSTMRATSRGMQLPPVTTHHTNGATDIQPHSDEDDDVEESAVLLPRQGAAIPGVPSPPPRAWWRVPVTWEIMVRPPIAMRPWCRWCCHCHRIHCHLSTQVGFCTAAIFICYADRSNISTAIIEMSKRYDWDQVQLALCLQKGQALCTLAKAMAPQQRP